MILSTHRGECSRYAQNGVKGAHFIYQSVVEVSRTIAMHETWGQSRWQFGFVADARLGAFPGLGGSSPIRAKTCGSVLCAMLRGQLTGGESSSNSPPR